MKNSRLFLSATAFILAISGTLAMKAKTATKAAGTKSTGPCRQISDKVGNTASGVAGHTLLTNSNVVYSWNGGACQFTMFTNAD